MNNCDGFTTNEFSVNYIEQVKEILDHNDVEYDTFNYDGIGYSKMKHSSNILISPRCTIKIYGELAPIIYLDKDDAESIGLERRKLSIEIEQFIKLVISPYDTCILHRVYCDYNQVGSSYDIITTKSIDFKRSCEVLCDINTSLPERNNYYD